MVKRTPAQAQIALLAIIATIMIGWILHVGATILQPLVIALLLGGMLQPVVKSLARYKIPPVLTVIALTVLLFFGLAQLGLLLQQNITRFFAEADSPTAPVQIEAQPAEDWTELIHRADVLRLQRNYDKTLFEMVKASLEKAEELPPDDEEQGAEEAPRDAEQAEDDPDHVLTSALAALDQMASLPESPIARPFIPSAQRMLTEAYRFGQAEIEPPGGYERIIGTVEDRMRRAELPPQLIDGLLRMINDVDVEGAIKSFAFTGVGFVRGLVLVIIYLLFIFAEQAVFRRKILAVAGERRAEAVGALDTMTRGIQRYLGVKTVTSLATGILCYSVLVSLGIPYAPLFGFLTFLLNYIPTFGSILAAVLPTLAALDGDDGVFNATIVVTTYLSVNVILGSYLEPKILGRELNLSPLVVVISVVFWAGLWGIVGTFLAVPLTAAAQIVLASNDTTRPIAMLLSSGPPREGRRGRKPEGDDPPAQSAA